MPGRRAIKDAILEGVHTANVEYERWSNGWWITDSGVEGLVVAAIARKLKSKFSRNESLAMEIPFHYIKEWSEARRPRGRPPKTLKGSKRADLVLLDEDEKPTHVVEVKREWNRSSCFQDLERIRDLVLRYGQQMEGSLKGGFLAMMLAKKTWGRSACDRIREQEQKIMEMVNNEFDRKGLTLRCHLGNMRKPGNSRWSHASFCIELR